LDFRISQGSVETYCRRYEKSTYIENFLRNQLVKEFWKSVQCQSYYQTSSGFLFWDTVYIIYKSAQKSSKQKTNN